MNIDMRTIITMTVRIIAMAILAKEIIPIMWAESKVSNGIGRVRKSLLALGILLFISLLVPSTFVLFQMSGHPNAEFTSIIGYSRTAGDFISVLMLWVIYKRGGKAND